MSTLDWSDEEVSQVLAEEALNDILTNKTVQAGNPPISGNKVEYEITTKFMVYTFFLCNEGYLWLNASRIDGTTDDVSVMVTESVNSIDRIIRGIDKRIRKI